MPTTVRRALLLTVIALLLSACGQKGPLYLPEQDERDQSQQR